MTIPTSVPPAPPFAPATAAAPRVYRGAVIGLGGIARHAHLPAFLNDPAVRCRLHIVATVDERPADPPVESVPHVCDRRALADLEPIDFVDICTPTASHLELVLWALEQGYHVLCEKPVAVTRREAQCIADAARAAGRVVMPCHQHRCNPVWGRVREWLAEGAIGRWHLAELHVYRAAADRGMGAVGTPWRGVATQSRGGVLLDHGTHLVYQVLDAAGLPAAVHAWTGRLRHADYDVEDSATLLLEYPDRAALLFLTWAARERENRVRFIGDRGSIEWLGGVLRLERDGVVSSFDHTAELDKRASPGWFSTLFRAFADAMDRGDREPHLRDLTEVAMVLESAYTAARTGCRVALG
jgi:predicted dehydrogenase